MKSIIRVIKNNYKIVIAFVLGLVISGTSVYAVEAYIESKKVSYTNHNKENVEEAIDELYEKSGIHKDKWIDPILNGADPVLKNPLIPVVIKNNGEVYYANENSEWYNYSEKRWANAVILVDNPSNENYKIGDHILEDDIESYFVWIPRYQYKIWNMGQYNSAVDGSKLTNSKDNSDSSLRKLLNNNELIDIVFGSVEKISKMNENEASLDNYYTHPAFTLGDKNLNGIWVGKFETGYKGATSKETAEVNKEDSKSIIIKPDVYAWRKISIKNAFMASYNYEREFDSHMMKNTEWGAVVYLSHSQYGLSGDIKINNNSDFKTGFASAIGVNQNKYPGTYGNGNEITQLWNTTTGYLASTTGNITGVYDMSGGTYEHLAAHIKNNVGSSNFIIDEINNFKGYIDEYNENTTYLSYNNRILGDATGEMGPFYIITLDDGSSNYYRTTWFSDTARFLDSSSPWFVRGGTYSYGYASGDVHFNGSTGSAKEIVGFRLALAI